MCCRRYAMSWRPTAVASRRLAAAGRATGPSTIAAGTPRDKDNARAKVMAPAVKRADELLVEGAERSAQALPVLLNPALPDE